MRNDPTKGATFKGLDLWDDQKYVNQMMVNENVNSTASTSEHFGFFSNSLSGRERNRLFLRYGDNFTDLTLVSGADDMADGRSYSIIDYDQDGWQDIALMTLNAPRFKLYRNEMGNLFPKNKPFRFRLIGGNRNAVASLELSNHDAIGARVLVTFASGKIVMMHKQAGEGFASQNSETLSIGIPPGDSVESLKIRWPSGKTSVVDSPNESEILTIEEPSD